MSVTDQGSDLLHADHDLMGLKPGNVAIQPSDLPLEVRLGHAVKEVLVARLEFTGQESQIFPPLVAGERRSLGAALALARCEERHAHDGEFHGWRIRPAEPSVLNGTNRPRPSRIAPDSVTGSIRCSS